MIIINEYIQYYINLLGKYIVLKYKLQINQYN